MKFVCNMADDDSETDKILDEFLSWCDTNGLVLSKKVKVSLQGSCHRYGMIATDQIEKGECLFEIPRALLLQPKTSSISGILGNLTDEDQYATKRRTGWAPLLLALMYEYTNQMSHWKPYLNLVPDITVLDQPMFWGEDERCRELEGTGIEEDVESDVQHIEKEYNNIALPFIRKHQQYFSESCHTLDLYKHMAAFVMAYSFTEKSPNNDGSNDDDENAATAPTMVPMADILNHISKNNAHLEFGTESLTMVAIRNISKGQEIFNTYGKLENCHLLQSYGFVEEDLPNPYDMVDIPIAAFHDVMEANQSSKATKVLNAKIEFMEEMSVASEDDVFLFGREGCSHFGPDLYATLRILHLTEEEFKQVLEEQINKQRSEEFEDIAYVFDQQDEKMKRDSSWRILEQVFKADKKKVKKKRRMDEEKAAEKKKVKMDLNDEDCNVKITPESASRNEDRNDEITPFSYGCLETDNVLSHNNSDLNPSVGGASSSCVLDGNLAITETKAVRKSVKKDLAKGWGETFDEERAEEEKISDSSECESGDGDDNSHDDDDDEEEVEEEEEGEEEDGDDNSNDDDDDDGEEEDGNDDHEDGYDNGDDDDDDDDEDDDDDDDATSDSDDDDDEAAVEKEDKDESEQSLTYDLLSEWSLEWRRTLKSVAEFCVKKREGDGKLNHDATENSNLSRRQLSAFRLRQAQRSIFQRICELEDKPICLADNSFTGE